MNAIKRFCFGCNEKIALGVDQDTCPHCGQTLSAVVDAPTLEFTRLQERGTYFPDLQSTDSEVMELVGKPFANYTIERLLGRGGMAWVFLARHATLWRPCAVKILNRQLSPESDERVAMFLAEARAAAALVHPHVVAIHSLGEDQGWHFIEMEYVDGTSLHSRIATQAADPIQATEWMMQICSALAAAHQAGIIHRDLKPANVLVTATNCAKLADFGLAKRIAQSGTGTQPMVGTPYYMAPELFLGQPADQRSDIYAMGVTYFYLLTQRMPFLGTTVQQLAAQHAGHAIPDPRQLRGDVPQEAYAVVQRCLAKSRTDRYADAIELLSDLRSVFGSLRSLESLLRQALEGLNLSVHGTGDRFELQVALHGGRRQTVMVESTEAGPRSERLVKIYSRCGPVHAEFLRRALELNATIPHGSIAIETVNGAAQFVMGNAYPRATCDPEEIRKSVLTIARHADGIEQQLTGRDDF
jgi:serine/threonine-protein kinase